MDTKCVVVGPAASDLSLIAREAADAQNQADEIEAYLRNSSPNWQTLAYQMDYLDENIRNLQKFIAGFERREPRLTDAQSQQLERLKAGLATLTVFANNTNRLIAEKQLMPYRDALVANAKAMNVRAGIIRDAARSLRVVKSA
jgi:ABC-type transporter Mla subunit MlaD